MKKNVAGRYVEYLSNGNMKAIIDLFSNDGIVYSPLYGRMKAKEFYPALQRDTEYSDVVLMEVFENEKADQLVLYLAYQWTMRSGKTASFEVMDIMRFNDINEIVELKIIYDTQDTRVMLGEIRGRQDLDYN